MSPAKPTIAVPTIAVIGAGLGGLTAAGLLQQAGFAVTVYEQAPSFSRIGAGIHLSSNVMLVMRRLGIEQALSAIGLHPDAFVSRAWNTGETLFELPFTPEAEAHYGAEYINVHRGDLHQVLESALHPHTVQFGKKLCAIDDTTHQTNLTFDDHTTASADIVIGADGLNSAVRAHLFGPEPPRYSGNIAHRAIYPADRLNGLPIRACTKWWGPGHHILVYYMTQSREDVYLVSSFPDPTWQAGTNFAPCDPAEFRAAFAAYHPELQQAVAAATEVTKWPVFDRPSLPHWSDGRLVLLGDACHPLMPYMASGAAMAIEDAAVLARCIIQFPNHEEAFKRYEATRVPRVEKVREISKANTWLKYETDPDWLFQYDACETEISEAVLCHVEDAPSAR